MATPSDTAGCRQRVLDLYSQPPPAVWTVPFPLWEKTPRPSGILRLRMQPLMAAGSQLSASAGAGEAGAESSPTSISCRQTVSTSSRHLK